MIGGCWSTATSTSATRRCRPPAVPRRRRPASSSSHSGTNGLAMPTLSLVPPDRLAPQRRLRRASAARRRAASSCQSLDRSASSALDPYERRPRDPHARRGGRVLDPPQRAPRGTALQRLQRLAARALAEEEPRLRGLLVVPAQHPEAAAAEIRRLGGRDEFVGVFLPGGARIPYGNPVYDPIWAAARRARPAGRRAHALRGRRHRRAHHPGGDARLLRRVPRALRLGHVRALRLDPLPRRVRALPATRAGDDRGRARPVRRASSGGSTRTGAPAAARSPGASGRRPSTSGSTSASPPSRSSRRTTGQLLAGDRVPAPVGHALFASDYPALGLRRAATDAAAAPRGLARRRRATRNAGEFFGLPTLAAA